MSKKNTKGWESRDYWEIDAQWSGTAMIYTATGLASFVLSGDYNVTYADESEPEDLRATRMYRKSCGQRVRKVPKDKLADELVVIFGAQITASKALQTLKALIARIEDEGLLIGHVGDGDSIYETVGRDLTLKDARRFDVGNPRPYPLNKKTG